MVRSCGVSRPCRRPAIWRTFLFRIRNSVMCVTPEQEGPAYDFAISFHSNCPLCRDGVDESRRRAFYKDCDHDGCCANQELVIRHVRRNRAGNSDNRVSVEPASSWVSWPRQSDERREMKRMFDYPASRPIDDLVRMREDLASALVCPVHDTVMQRRWITFRAHGNVRSVEGLSCAVPGCGIHFDQRPKGGFYRIEATFERRRFISPPRN
jgi:hypothetical protein